MFYMQSKHEDVTIYAETIEQDAISQILDMANSPLGENAHIRIMPDAHAGKGCVIGTTMKITDKICPNLVGVDIGCGVTFAKTNIDFKNNLKELDAAIRKHVPYGMNVHEKERDYKPLKQLRCWDKLTEDERTRARMSIGTLGGGNHFLEAYEDNHIAVHSGSRNLGKAVAVYYQKLAEQRITEYNKKLRYETMQTIEPQKREEWLKNNKISVNTELSYLTGSDMKDYLHDIQIVQMYAKLNRITMLENITKALNGEIISHFDSIHNYIDMDNMILRKGAISAQKDEELVIPLNMRDGLLLCKGKSNPEWNYSAPHGAGRLYSRSRAKQEISLDDYKDTMKDIFTTCVNESTIDESPFAYKDYKEIMDCIEPTVEIVKRFIPIFNFKAN